MLLGRSNGDETELNGTSMKRAETGPSMADASLMEMSTPAMSDRSSSVSRSSRRRVEPPGSAFRAEDTRSKENYFGGSAERASSDFCHLATSSGLFQAVYSSTRRWMASVRRCLF